MNLLERLLPSLRRSPEMASIKKDLSKEKKENIEARNRVLVSIEAIVNDFRIYNKSSQKLIDIIDVKENKNSPKRKR